MQVCLEKGQEVLAILNKTSRILCMGPQGAPIPAVLLIPHYLTLCVCNKCLEAQNKDAKRIFTAINYSQTTSHFHIPHAIQRCHKILAEITSDGMLVMYFCYSSKKIFAFHDRAE